LRKRHIWVITQAIQANIAHGKTVYTVKVTTVPDGDKLKAAIHVKKDGIPHAGEVVFTNTRQLLKTRDSAMYTALLIALAGGAWVLRRRETDSK